MTESMNGLIARLEAMLFAAAEPVSVGELAAAAGCPETDVETALETMDRRLRDGADRGLRLIRVAGGYELQTDAAHAEAIEALLRTAPEPLSEAALEVLALVAYKQPITRAELEAVRGVSSDSVLRTLIRRGLVDELGRRDAPGRPYLYGTTDAFLTAFNLDSLDDLPPVEDLEALPTLDSA